MKDFVKETFRRECKTLCGTRHVIPVDTVPIKEQSIYNRPTEQSLRWIYTCYKNGGTFATFINQSTNQSTIHSFIYSSNLFVSEFVAVIVCLITIDNYWTVWDIIMKFLQEQDMVKSWDEFENGKLAYITNFNPLMGTGNYSVYQLHVIRCTL